MRKLESCPIRPFTLSLWKFVFTAGVFFSPRATRHLDSLIRRCRLAFAHVRRRAQAGAARAKGHAFGRYHRPACLPSPGPRRRTQSRPHADSRPPQSWSRIVRGAHSELKRRGYPRIVHGSFFRHPSSQADEEISRERRLSIAVAMQ